MLRYDTCSHITYLRSLFSYFFFNSVPFERLTDYFDDRKYVMATATDFMIPYACQAYPVQFWTETQHRIGNTMLRFSPKHHIIIIN